ncbi:MAG: VOC family protein, partial [Planctomycetales bacterium]|nr:VOC family protein [Planctomycetales bacterium]
AMTPPEIHSLCPLLQVFDMPLSLAFYRDVLGFEVVQQSSPGDSCDWVWLKCNAAQLMLNTMFESDSRPAIPNEVRNGHHGDTGLFIETPHVDTMYEFLIRRGFAVEPPVVRPYGMKQLYLKDPDGYGICFQWPATGQVND